MIPTAYAAMNNQETLTLMTDEFEALYNKSDALYEDLSKARDHLNSADQKYQEMMDCVAKLHHQFAKLLEEIK